MTRFAKIGVGAGKTFEASKLTPELKRAIEDGMADAWVDLAKLQKRVDAKEVTSGDMFGTREYVKNNYLYRMAASHPSELEAKWLGCRRLSDQFTRRCSRRRGACRLYRTRHSVAAPAAAELGRQSTKHLRDSATIFRKVLNHRNWRTNTQDEPL